VEETLERERSSTERVEETLERERELIRGWILIRERVREKKRERERRN